MQCALPDRCLKTCLRKSSDAHELFRLTAWIHRFISNCRIKEEQRRCKEPLTNQEIDDAIKFWIRREQSIYYQKEIKIIDENKGIPPDEAKPIDPTSAILKFKPVMEEKERILRLGGRGGRSSQQFEQKHCYQMSVRWQSCWFVRHIFGRCTEASVK